MTAALALRWAAGRVTLGPKDPLLRLLEPDLYTHIASLPTLPNALNAELRQQAEIRWGRPAGWI